MREKCQYMQTVHSVKQIPIVKGWGIEKVQE